MADDKILNPQQMEAVKYNKGPLLVIAGAGTGKTTVITEKIKYLVLKEKIPTDHILALTFTEKAAMEMQERVDIALPYGYTQMWISTFHAFCERILKNDAIHIGLNSSYNLLTSSEAVLFLKSILDRLNLDYFLPLGNPNKFLTGLVNHFSRLKDEDVSSIQYLEYAKQKYKKAESIAEKEEAKKYLELSNAYKIYEDLKIKEGVMDFSDLIGNALKLFRQRPSILKEYQKQFEYVLVDEFQDTNFAQNELAILLTGAKKKIMAVGDDDQAIYRWRGAAISNIIQFRERFPEAKIVTLTKNYRSTKEILDRSYSLIQNNNPDRLEVKEKIDKRLSSERQIKGENTEFIFGQSVENEAEFVAGKIQKLADNNNFAYSDFAVLVRANEHALPFTQIFEYYGIPYQFLGPGQLFRKEEIRDLIAYLNVLVNFEDSASFYRVLQIGIFGFKGYEIAALLNLAKRENLSLFEAAEEAVSNNKASPLLEEEARKKIKSISGMIKRHLNLVPKTTGGQILYYFFEDSGLLNFYSRAKTQELVQKAQNVAKFFAKLKNYELEHKDASVFKVIEWINMALEMGESPLVSNDDWSQNNAVNILTIHSSKGLEFPVVFLVNLVKDRFPTRERNEQIPIPTDLIKEILPTGDFHLEEERRLFYVGMTRARDRLFLTASKFYAEGKRERKISPFVWEALGEEEVKKILGKTDPEGKQLTLLNWSFTKKNEKKDSPAQNPAITYLSYSQIQAFEICPLHYKLRYILKIPTPVTPSQSFGISVHATLRDFYQQFIENKSLKIDQVLSILEDNWISQGYESKFLERKALEKAKKIITDYLKKNLDKNIVKKNTSLETPFKFYIRGRGGWLKIGGRIDRITKSGNILEIIDYKTGTNVPTEKSLAENLQLTFYGLAATEIKENLLGVEPEAIRLSLHFLEKDIKLTTTRTKEELEKAKREILEKKTEIEASDFTCRKSLLCRTCEYKDFCNV
ncbi:ATP-dependent helicase [Patescibacteria group bacterium]|nr:ATP-dependent helicase [Patescibacteria group bacterium]MCL5010289.1 ATP-dependent helicase [Patescibacteria group bacterium]